MKRDILALFLFAAGGVIGVLLAVAVAALLFIPRPSVGAIDPLSTGVIGPSASDDSGNRIREDALAAGQAAADTLYGTSVAHLPAALLEPDLWRAVSGTLPPDDRTVARAGDLCRQMARAEPSVVGAWRACAPVLGSLGRHLDGFAFVPVEVARVSFVTGCWARLTTSLPAATVVMLSAAVMYGADHLHRVGRMSSIEIFELLGGGVLEALADRGLSVRRRALAATACVIAGTTALDT